MSPELTTLDPHFVMQRVDLHSRAYTFVGDCRQPMREEIAPGSVHCVVTSPPYWGLRDYGIPPVEWEDGERCVFGLESTVEGYVRHTLEIFEGLGRVLRDDGVIWWNIGDTFATGAGGAKNPGSQVGAPRGGSEGKHMTVGDFPASQPNRMPQSVGDGNKLLIPYRVAIALQSAGWVVREDVIWSKPSPMPISVNGVRWELCRVKVSNGATTGVTKQGLHENRQIAGFNERYNGHGAQWTNCPGCPKCESTGGWILRRGRWRPTTSHEVVLMVTKPGGYHCDAQAAAEASTYSGHQRSELRGAFTGSKGEPLPGREPFRAVTETRNPRSVWRIPSEPLKAKHFAAFPTRLAWKCIEASTSSAGCCPQCGSQHAPMVEKQRVSTRPGETTKVNGDSHVEGNRDPQRHIQRTNVLGYRPTCNCDAGEPVPCTVLDIFAGSGTTLQVAAHAGRIGIGCEVSADYIEIQRERVPTIPRCFQPDKKPSGRKRRKKHRHQQELFN